MTFGESLDTLRKKWSTPIPTELHHPNPRTSKEHHGTDHHGTAVLTRAVALSGVLAASVALGGCAAAAPSGPTTITFSYLWGGEEAKALEKIIADFNASQSDIKVVGVSSPDAQKQLTSMSSSNGSFDISDNFGNTVGSWASKGILAPWTTTSRPRRSTRPRSHRHPWSR